MGLLKKIGAALRGRQHDTMQAVVDHEAICILEQEIRDCQASVAKAKAEMANVVAENTACQRELDQSYQQQEDLEGRALRALQEDDQAMAAHFALQMADMEQAKTELLKNQQAMQGMERQLRDNLLRADRQIKQSVRELRLARASDCAGRGLPASQTHSSKLGGQLQQVQSSIDRIRERRLQAEDLAAASQSVEQVLGAEQIPDTDHRAREILERLKQSATA